MTTELTGTALFWLGIIVTAYGWRDLVTIIRARRTDREAATRQH